MSAASRRMCPPRTCGVRRPFVPSPLALARGLGLAAMLFALAAPAPAQTLGLGRLFTSTDERLALDMQRGASMPAQPGQMAAAGVVAPSPPAEVAAAAPPPEPVQLNGVVRRSNGKSTVWINQVPHADSDAQLSADQSVKLRLSSGRTLVLKPGQRFNPADGTVQEATGR